MLQGKTAIISGAASPRGIGLASARLFAAHGARVVILNIDLNATHEACASLGVDHIGLRCDVTDPVACQGARDAVLERFGAIDILINNAGITQPVETMDIDVGSWQLAAHPGRQPEGRAAAQPGRHPSHEGARQGVDRLHDLGVGPTRRRHLRPTASLGRQGGRARAVQGHDPRTGASGIRVNCVTPGLIETDIIGDKLTADMRAEIIGGIRSDVWERRLTRPTVPVSRIGPLGLRAGRRARRERRHADSLTSISKSQPRTSALRQSEQAECGIWRKT